MPLLSSYRELRTKTFYLFLDTLYIAIRQCSMNQPCDLGHLFFLHSAGGDGGRAETDAGWIVRRPGVVRDRGAARDDAHLFQPRLRLKSGDAFVGKIHEQEMIVCATRDKLESKTLERCRERFGVFHDLAGVCFE